MSNNFYKNIFLKYIDKCPNGYLVIKEKGQEHVFGNPKKEKSVIEVNNPDFYKRVILYSDIGLGESYVDNDWQSESLYNVLLWFLQNSSYLPDMAGSIIQGSLIGGLKFLSNVRENKNRKNDYKKAKENISFHYDLNNDFFKLMLDKTMAYSSGIYKTKKDTLAKSQQNKYETICQKLQLNSQTELLEIGSGWGGFAFYAAKKYKSKVTTLTISQEQFDYVKQLIKKEKMEKYITIELKDYRLKKGKFDKIVSIEMIEAIGHKQTKTFVSKCNELLKKGGAILLQAITYPDHHYESYVKKVNWIQKHIFPGSHLISIQNILTKLKENTTITLDHFENIGQSYAKTLNAWQKNLSQNKAKVFKLGFDESFFRKWFFYLVYCEAGFATSYINDAQILLNKEKDNFFPPTN